MSEAGANPDSPWWMRPEGADTPPAVNFQLPYPGASEDQPGHRTAGPIPVQHADAPGAGEPITGDGETTATSGKPKFDWFAREGA